MRDKNSLEKKTMVTVSYGADAAECKVDGMTVNDLLAKMRDGGIEGINQRIDEGDTVDVFVNDTPGDGDLILADKDRVVIQKTAELGNVLAA